MKCAPNDWIGKPATRLKMSRMAGLLRPFAIALFAAGCLAPGLFGQINGTTAGAPTSLERGKTTEGELAEGQSHEYSFTLQAGQYARVLVDQRSINIAVTVFAPDGKELFAGDSYPIGESESAEIIGESSGVFRLRLQASEPAAPKGRYTISLKDIEPATERHQMRVAAAAEYARSMTSFMQGARESILKSIDQLGKALAHWRAAGDRAGEALALVRISLAHAEIGNQEKALEYAAQAFPVAHDSHDPLTEARALDCLGQANFYFGDKRKAIAYFEQALPLMRAAGARAPVGATLSSLAVAYSRTGDKRQALAHFDEAMRIFRELQDRRMIAEVAGNMGVTYDDLGEYQRALESHQTDLALKRELGDRPNEAIAWNNIGTAYAGLAEYQKALDAYTSALQINRSTDNRRYVAINLNNIAWIYDQLADHQRALTFYRESLEIVRKVNDRRMVAVTINNIAETLADLGEYQKAAELHQEALSFAASQGRPMARRTRSAISARSMPGSGIATEPGIISNRLLRSTELPATVT